MNETFTHFKRNISNTKNLTIIAFGIVLLLILSLLSYLYLIKPKAKLAPYSREGATETRSYFDLHATDGYLYKAKNSGEDAIYEFLNKGMPVNGKALISQDVATNTKIERISKDVDLKFPTLDSTKEHYFLSQSIDGIKVFNSSIIIHLKSGSEIYSVTGNIVKSPVVTKSSITHEQAVELVIEKAKKEIELVSEFSVEEMEETIVNFTILGLSEDSTNYLSLPVKITSSNEAFSKIYYVHLGDGKIIHVEDLILHAINRAIYDCKRTADPTGCAQVRSEGSSASGVVDADNLYTYMQEIYDFYKNNYGRDGLDGVGGQMKGYVNIYSWGPKTCAQQPNAYHSPHGFMAYCPGAVVKDVTAHEFGHGVVSTTARLAGGMQYGALNESMGDVFASALDQNWTLGEGSIFGVLRSMSDPTSHRQPDKLFSPYYDCGGEEVHTNDGVPNKAFYLMTEGGSFNGCTVSGIGLERSKQIIYKALVGYLPSTANFYDMYTAINKACADLYGADSDVCKESAKAYQAVEMDQQPAGSARGAKCTGVAVKAATCAGAPTSSVPTLAPISGSPSPTGSSGTTPPPATSTGTPLPTAILSPTPTPRQLFTCVPDPKCVSSKKSIQLCPLICQAVAGQNPAPTSSVPKTTPSSVPTVPAGSTPTSAVTATPTGLPVDIKSIISKVSDQKIKDYMTQLVMDSDTTSPNELQSRWSSYNGEGGRPKGNKTEAEYIKSQFDSFGLTSSYQSFPVSGTTSNNIIGKLTGEDSNTVYLVTSHMDSRGDAKGTGNAHAPGADDNASGTSISS